MVVSMEHKERKLQKKLWLSTAFGSISAFIILKLLWKEANPMFLNGFLVLGFLLNMIITLYKQNNSEDSS